MIQYVDFTYLAYEQMILAAQKHGYTFISFDQFREQGVASNKSCLLRHDCDNDLSAALRMAKLENKLEVVSTYFLSFHAEMYNLQSISNLRLVREIISLGHHIGLHFDHGFYANIKNEDVADIVDYECKHLESLLDAPVKVMSFHQPSESVMRQEIKVGMMNTYDHDDMRGVFYISDSNMSWRDRRPYDVFISEDYQVIQLLIHPEWWADENTVVGERWVRMFEDNFSSQQETLRKLEKSFNDVLDIKIVRK